MKRILITGAGSYIGTSFDRYLKEKYPGQYEVDTVDMVDGSWRKKSFSGYDSVFHVAGIAHRKETEKNAELYYKVNRDLAADCAAKAKNDGVKQFVFLSSMSVYGLNSGYIGSATLPNPKTNYGKSKLQAEIALKKSEAADFAVAVLRPPMIYGKGCRGNYNTLKKIALKSPFFPNIDNKRSMLYIENLCRFVRALIDNRDRGLFFPQNKEYVNTTRLAELICKYNGKKFRPTVIFNPALYLLRKVAGSAEKAFGDLVYDMSMSEYSEKFAVTDIETSIRFTEGK